MYAAEYIDYDYMGGDDFKVEKTLEYIEQSDLVVWNRHCPIDINHILEIRKRTGLKIVVDLDDWIELPFKHPLYRQYKEQYANLVIENLKVADLVTVTTSRLWSKVKQFNKRVEVLPNALPFGLGQFKVNDQEKGDLFNFVYAGQSSHLEDVSLLINPMKRIKALQNISFTMAGYTKHPIWDKMEAVFRIHPNFRRFVNKPLESYMEIYDHAHCSIVPLVHNTFNSCKSNLKLLEAASKKLPVIVSAVPPYSDDNRAPVLWVNNQSDWFKHINYLAKNPAAAIDLGEKLNEWATRNYSIFEMNKARFDLYRNLIK